MSETSLEAYRTLSIANLENKEREVMAEFFTNLGLVVTRETLAQRLGWKESAVCGRANSLVAKKVLEEIEGGRTSSGRKAKLLRLPVAGQGGLFA